MPTTLTAGDIAFSAFQADNNGGGFNGDAFEFILLVPVTTGTTIYFTDSGYRTDLNAFRGNEGLVRWVAQGNLLAGTVITFTNPAGNGVASTAEWTGINTATGAALTTATISLATGGDNITALINPIFGATDPVIIPPATTPSPLVTGTAIAAITFGGATFAPTFTATSGNATTALPPGLTDGVNAISIAATDNGRYNDAAAGSVEAGIQAAVRASLNNDAYWTTSTTPLPVPFNTNAAAFTIVPTIEQAGNAALSVLNGLYQVTNTTTNVAQNLTYGGVTVSPTQYPGWSILGVEIVGTGLKAMWKSTSGQYWLSTDTDNGGIVEPSAYEVSFNQDFNGDGIIGALPLTPIESFGTTTLSTNAINEYIATNSSGSVNLKYGGANLKSTTFAGWFVVGAEIVGPEVKAMWKSTNGGFWYSTNTDNGMSVSDVRSYESIFQQDFNGDGNIGAVGTTVVEALGTTTLSIDNATNLYIANNGTGPVNIQFGGTNVGPNTYAGWSIVGAEVDAGVVKAMWKSEGQFYYSTNTDPGGVVATTALGGYESVFQQDFNGNGLLGS